jgi:hypothetical protein
MRAIRDASTAGERLLSSPIIGNARCCARAASGHATAAPPTSAMNSRPAQYLVDKIGGAPEQVRQVWSVGHQTCRFDGLAIGVACRQSPGHANGWDRYLLEHRPRENILVAGDCNIAGVRVDTWPFYGAVLWARVLAILFAPLYRRLSRSMQRHNLAAFATLVIIVVIVIQPSTLITASLVQEATGVYSKFQSGELNVARVFSASSAPCRHG